MRIGIDIGSTTLKCVVTDDAGNILLERYERHYSNIHQKTAEMLRAACAERNISRAKVAVTGSAGMGVAEQAGLPFVQEVYAARAAIRDRLPETDVIVELGGEDAKILYLSGGGLEMRMNGSCAGGTGAFIDQMATLLGITPSDMDAAAAAHEKIYTIASRCGVFAKSDIQALLNQGCSIEDISASIFYAVVHQTIAGLAQGREITGNVVYLGGPLTYFPELRKAFDDTLKRRGVCPEHSLYFVALGAALCADGEECNLFEAIQKIGAASGGGGYRACEKLFENQEEYEAFRARHARANVPEQSEYVPGADYWLGVDAGSTTVKAAVIGREGEILFSCYRPSGGNPVGIIKEFLTELYRTYPDIRIAGAASTGYGEELVKAAFRLDGGVVETMAHFLAAKHFSPDLDFILDIGGQDIKCFKIRNNAIDNIFLNEACSSGCGSFLQTFAGALGYGIEEFAKLGLFADKPVDLGSRCTVFMNSSVKQAQKDGATVANISAGLSISVVKNALYKVIRAVSADALGKRIVVQGGTFLNDAVLRAFEQELGREVVRPNIAGLMGAYGAALYAQKFSGSKILNAAELEAFTYATRATTCKGCENHCRLTINTFDGGRKFIAGNRCEQPGAAKRREDALNLYEYKRKLLSAYGDTAADGPVVGIPMGLNMYELLPFWHTFWKELGFSIRVSPASDRATYLRGQFTIPSDTICYPAKLLHGHVDVLLGEGVDAVFYPCMSYNFDEGLGDNHYNCPVVAYYPEVLEANVPALKRTKFIYDYVGPHRRKDFPKKMLEILNREFPGHTLRQVKRAADAAYAAYAAYLAEVRKKGAQIFEEATAAGRQIIVLAGRPYHLDPEVNHGIDGLISDLGAAVLSEEAVSCYERKFPVKVLNQWTYHARLYAAAKYVAELGRRDVNLVQTVSFGCGLDAITADETRRILESAGKIYTQLKIDEIANLGAVKIRLRSLFEAALAERR